LPNHFRKIVDFSASGHHYGHRRNSSSRPAASRQSLWSGSSEPNKSSLAGPPTLTLVSRIVRRDSDYLLGLICPAQICYCSNDETDAISSARVPFDSNLDTRRQPLDYQIGFSDAGRIEPSFLTVAQGILP